MEIINALTGIYKWLVQLGISPIAVLSVLGITHFLKSNFRVYSGTYKPVFTLLTAFILGIGFSFLSCLLTNLFIWNYIVINSLLNFLVSAFSTNFIDILKEIKNKKLS